MLEAPVLLPSCMSQSIPYDSIILKGRYRNPNQYGDVTGLAESLGSIGTIHPIVLAKQPDGVYLVAGGRRHRALGLRGCKELWEGSTLDPARPGFVWRENVPAHQMLEAELDENLHRLDMGWVDKVLLCSDIHLAKKSQDIKWGYVATAAIMGSGFSKTNVGYAVTIAARLRAGDEELKKCSSLIEAIQTLLKRQQDSALAEATKRLATRTTNKPIMVVSPTTGVQSGVLDKIGEITSPKKTWTATIDPLKAPTDSVAVAPKPNIAVVPLTQMFILGNSIGEDMPPNLSDEEKSRFTTNAMSRLPDASFDHIVTDIPYGIDMENLTEKDKGDVAAQHDVDSNVALMRPFLEQAFRLCKSSGYCVFFYDLDHHEKLQHWAKEVGWTVQAWPLTWIKTHPCKNNSPGFNFTKTTEVAMVLRRDTSSVLRKVMTESHWIGDGAAERKLYNNKFAKPSGLWRWIYEAVAFQGQSVFDPYWGEGSSSRAAANMGLLPYGIEINPVHYNRGIDGMKAVYALIHKSNVEFQ